MKVLSVFAGPNGSGKTTIQERYPYRTPGVNINTDDLTLKMGSEVAGGREAIRLQNAELKKGNSFTIETTLSGNSALKLMKKAKEQGYRINLYFICTASVDINIGRVSSRVKLGGHDVPREAIDRRYRRSIGNLQKAIEIADTSHLFDNSGSKNKHVLSVIRNRVRLNRREKTLVPWLPEKIASKVHSIIRDRSRSR